MSTDQQFVRFLANFVPALRNDRLGRDRPMESFGMSDHWPTLNAVNLLVRGHHDPFAQSITKRKKETADAPLGRDARCLESWSPRRLIRRAGEDTLNVMSIDLMFSRTVPGARLETGFCVAYMIRILVALAGNLLLLHVVRVATADSTRDSCSANSLCPIS